MANLGENFYNKLVQVSSELGMKPEDLIAVMVSESGLNPTAVEKKHKASGLIGFMPNTLKGIGFKGTWEDFIKLSGEQQLDYVKKVVQGNMRLNGGPFKSAAQYYVSNLWPVALKLPGIRQGDPNTVILEENPERGGANNKYSKKYLDVGSRIDADFESKAYKANPLFDRSKKGAITYDDIIKQVEINKRNPIYLKAIEAMKSSTGHQIDNMVDMSKYRKSNQPISWDQSQNSSLLSMPSLDTLLNKYLQQVAASEKQNKKIYKKYLPINNLLITIHANDYTNKIEFARILSNVLEEELLAKAYTHTDGSNVEINCNIQGPQQECLYAVNSMVESASDAFRSATNKIGEITITASVHVDKQSSCNKITFKMAEQQYRKFLLKFAVKGV